MRRTVSISLAVAGLLASCGRVPEGGTTSRTAPIVGGAPDPGHEAVGALILARGLCSGTLIAPRVVLTAAHCLVDGGQPIGFVLGESSFGAQLDIVDARIHPGHAKTAENGSDVEWNDVALLRLAVPAPVAPMDWARNLPDDFPGRTVTLVGFGQGITEPAGDRRSVAVEVSDVWSHGFWNRTSLPYPKNSCLGDSGGPTLLDTPDGEVVAGVVSSGDPDCVESGYNTRLDVDAAFLDEVLALWAGSGDAAEVGADLSDAAEGALADADPDGEEGHPDALEPAPDDGVETASLPDVPDEGVRPDPGADPAGDAGDVGREGAAGDTPLCGSRDEPLCETQDQSSGIGGSRGDGGQGCAMKTKTSSSIVPPILLLVLPWIALRSRQSIPPR